MYRQGQIVHHITEGPVEYSLQYPISETTHYVGQCNEIVCPASVQSAAAALQRGTIRPSRLVWKIYPNGRFYSWHEY